MSQAQRKFGNADANTPDNFGFGLAGRPGRLFPFAHLSDCDYRNWHAPKLH
jgi:hypothetical protein